ncbi:ABC-F type ribosomal protection protein [Lachnospiraceae bacterium KGMB03038]|nr:ABC-F type ribosomal protection protein [Lachnospiraceae bacterium KGMB03038]
MSMIDVADLSFTYEGGYEPVFEQVSFRIDTDWKLGFIGRNGRGKTTFLNLLMGKYPYEGKIISSVEFVYFPFPIKDEKKMALEVLEEVNPQIQQWQILKELNVLKVDAQVLYQPFENLSGGEKTKLLLAALFLGENRFLLIDEPTNHLDLEARRVTADYLNKKKGFILVSHDRKFLDGCVDHILSINRTNIEIRKGDFSSWYRDKEARDQMERQQNERLRAEIGRLGQAARQTGNWSDKVEKSKKGKKAAGSKIDRGYVGHKAAKMMKRAKTLEQRREKAVQEKQGLLKDVEQWDALKMFPLEHHAQQLAVLRNVSISYGERSACRDITFSVGTGERICLDGRNGCGKSTLMKEILRVGRAAKEDGAGETVEGEVWLPAGVKISYVPQEVSGIKGNLEELAEKAGLDLTIFLTLLRKLDFGREQFGRDISSYSAGQKKKVLLAKSLCERAHIYIWDEPLNYIDLLSRIQIEELLLEAQPTMLFVEHDQAFREKIATRTIRL